MAGSVSGIDKGTKAPRILSDAWENGCQRGRMDMSKYSREDIIRMVEDEDVEFIRLQFTDIFGILKNVAITASQLNKALNNDCMFDGSAIEGFVALMSPICICIRTWIPLRSFRGVLSRAKWQD